MTAIPTMPCPDCRGRQSIPDYLCARCGNHRLIPRPPLTADQVRALPDGAQATLIDLHGDTLRGVLYASKPGRVVLMYVDDKYGICRHESAVGECRVWLAKDADV